jgi:hypothetical protein
VTAPDAGSGGEASRDEQWALGIAIAVTAAGLGLLTAAKRVMSRRG